MEAKAIVARARKLLARKDRPFVMGTVSRGGKPHLRYMGAAVFEAPFTLYLETVNFSRKVDDVVTNSRVELLLASEDFSEVVNIEGNTEIETSAEKRKEVWAQVPASAEYFKGIDDPNFGVIRFTGTRVSLWNSRGQREPHVAEL